MSRIRSRSGSLLLGLLGLYLFVYPWAILLIALDRVPVWGTWMGGALLILQGTMMAVWLSANYGWRGTLSALLILLIGWAVEYIGVTTGFPFGGYQYTGVLWPEIADAVPLAIPFAWLLVVPAAIGVTDRLLGARAGLPQPSPGGGLMLLPVAASFATLLDVTIEPVAVHINGYWIWDSMSGYYGVPLSNFAAWWMTSLLLVAIVLWLRRAALRINQQRGIAPLLVWLPLLLYLLNLTMFVLVNLAHRQVAAAAIGTLILSYLAFDRVEPLLVRWVLGMEQSDTQQGEA